MATSLNNINSYASVLSNSSISCLLYADDDVVCSRTPVGLCHFKNIFVIVDKMDLLLIMIFQKF